MKKSNKKLLSSFIYLTIGGICLSLVLSSCALIENNENDEGNNPNDDILTPPNDGDDNDKDENDDNLDNENPNYPSDKPEIKPPINKPNEPNPPENKPTTPPNSSLINEESIKLKDDGKLLPSQYLLELNNLKNLNIDKTKIVENFDNSIITETRYVVWLLDDWNGYLSIKMLYKSKIDNNFYEFVFNFTNLISLKNQNYNLSFNVKNKCLLNAKEISNKKINNDDDAKSFLEYLNELDTSLIFKNDASNLPIEYLNFEGGISFNGFKENWYTSNSDLELNVIPKLLKINIYEKKENSNSINIRNINYPTNLIGSSKYPIKLVCSSILDFLLKKITSNDTYLENKFASYYYYDIVNDEGIQTQLQLTNNKWLKNVENSVNDYNIVKYRPVISKTINPNIDHYGNLIIQIQMQINDDGILSKESKELTIKSFLPTNKELFYYNNGSKDNKFNLICDPAEQDEVLKIIKKNENFNNIKKDIDNSNDYIVNVSKYFRKKDHIKFKNKIKLYFGDSEIKYNKSSNYYTSTNNVISIEYYLIEYLNNDNVTIQYNKKNNCFQTKFVLSIDCQGIDYDYSKSDEMIVNITKINASLT